MTGPGDLSAAESAADTPADQQRGVRPGDRVISREHNTGNASVVWVTEVEGVALVWVTVQIGPGEYFTAPTGEFELRSSPTGRHGFAVYAHAHGPESVCSGASL